MDSDILHDIRNSINCISLMAEVLTEDLQDKPDALKLVKGIRSQVTEMTRLVRLLHP